MDHGTHASPPPPDRPSASLSWRITHDERTGILHVSLSGPVTTAPLPALFSDIAAAMRHHQAHRVLADARAACLHLTFREVLCTAPLVREFLPAPTDRLAILFTYLEEVEHSIRHALHLHRVRVAIFEHPALALSWLTAS